MFAVKVEKVPAVHKIVNNLGGKPPGMGANHASFLLVNPGECELSLLLKNNPFGQHAMSTILDFFFFKVL